MNIEPHDNAFNKTLQIISQQANRNNYSTGTIKGRKKKSTYFQNVSEGPGFYYRCWTKNGASQKTRLTERETGTKVRKIFFSLIIFWLRHINILWRHHWHRRLRCLIPDINQLQLKDQVLIRFDLGCFTIRAITQHRGYINFCLSAF